MEVIESEVACYYNAAEQDVDGQGVGCGGIADI